MLQEFAEGPGHTFMQNVKDRDKAMMEMKRELKKLQVREGFSEPWVSSWQSLAE
jgi:hypothetical protein